MTLALLFLLPNVCDIHVSNTAVPSPILFQFLEECVLGEKHSYGIIFRWRPMWKYVVKAYARSGNAVRDINMDDSLFSTEVGRQDWEK
mmetsp:Transcript_8720/g.8556  ORF Transcript_8720/g.8556 Transcript_8720/m.8556 type:complete len:88 (-) Transcript_8720:30-293(-)